MWISLDLHNRDNDHLVEDKLWKQHGPTNRLDHGKRHLQPRRGSERARPGNRDVDHLVQQLEKIYGLTNCLDHERLPLRRERDVDDLEGLQLRRLRSISSLDHRHMSLHTTGL